MNLIKDHSYCRVPSQEIFDALMLFAAHAGLPVDGYSMFTGWIGYRDHGMGLKIGSVNADNAELDMSGYGAWMSIPEFVAALIEEAGMWEGPFSRSNTFLKKP